MVVSGKSRVWRRHPFSRLLGLFLAAVPAPCVIAATFDVNSTVDVVDANPGDGICETASGNTVCTLRAAIMEANALSGADTINLHANKTYTLELPGTDDLGLNGDLDVLDSVTIVGAGPASSIIDGNGLVTGDRIMTVFSCIGSATPIFECPDGTNIVATISGVGFTGGHTAAGIGGALLNLSNGLLTIHDCAFTENFARYGGGIHNDGPLDISNSTVAGNTVAGNDVSGGGAGIYTAGPMTMVDTTVRDNVIQGSPGTPYGGGIYVTGTTTINRSTITNNSAGVGGGIYALAATLHLINSTISGNYSYLSGGGLAMVTGGTVALYNVTIAGNVANSDASAPAEFGGGLYKESGTLTFRNSILTGNLHLNQMGAPSYDECFGGFTSAGNNIVTVPIGGICQITGSYAAVDASLGPLQDNGGPTQTHALTSGSLAAIDKGNDLDGCTDDFGNILGTDQRGEPRPAGAACDIGAFEFGAAIFKNGFEL